MSFRRGGAHGRGLSAGESKFFVVLAPVLVVAFPFIELLVHHQYPLFNPEAGLLFVAVLLVGLVLGVINLGHVIVRTALLSLATTIAFTVQLDLAHLFTLGLLVSLIIVGGVLHRYYSTVTLVFFLTMSAVGIIRGSDNVTLYPEVRPGDPSLPAYVHLVLDAHIGMGGIPLDVPGGAELKRDLEAFYANNGFTVFDKAYSHYVATANSLRNLFEFTIDDQNHYVPTRHGAEVTQLPDRPRYFRILRDQGYALRVFHPEYIHYCSGGGWVSYCRRYPNINLSSIENSTFSPWQKAELMAQTLLKQSSLAEGYYKILQLKHGLPELEATRIPAVNPQLIQQLAGDLAQHPRGYAYIVHLLMPHTPFVYDAACSLQTRRPLSETRAQNSDLTATLSNGAIHVIRGHNTAQSRALRYGHYFDQVRCAMKSLDEVFAALRTAGVYDDAVIVVHGDHGSKIATLAASTLWRHEMSRNDYIDMYSSLFAVKQGRTGFASDEFPSLQHILANVVAEAFSVPLDVDNGPPFVYMQSESDPSKLEKTFLSSFIEPVSDGGGHQ